MLTPLASVVPTWKWGLWLCERKSPQILVTGFPGLAVEGGALQICRVWPAARVSGESCPTRDLPSAGLQMDLATEHSWPEGGELEEPGPTFSSLCTSLPTVPQFLLREPLSRVKGRGQCCQLRTYF